MVGGSGRRRGELPPVIDDPYRGAASGWASGAALVYGPLARELVATCADPLQERLVLDAGAGTGVVSEALSGIGAFPVALDFSVDMLCFERRRRPPAVAASVLDLPFPRTCFDAVLAAFVLNHVADPVAGLRELRRVARVHSPVLVSVFSTSSSHAGRDRVDDVAVAHGFAAPAWYTEMKAAMVPLLGSAERMGEAAGAAGLSEIEVDERAVDVGVERATDLVTYRFGQAGYTAFVAALDRGRRQALFEEAVAAAGDPMEPYRPRVVFLRARA